PHGRGGLLLHAGEPAGRLHLHRQRRHGRRPPPEIRLQRPGHPLRRVAVGEDHRDRDGGAL
ncbi:MAG: Amidohydrolase family protein, partial [uncultured Microvirga sp.]